MSEQTVQFNHNKPWPMLRAFVSLGLLSAVLIVSVYYLTLPVIKANKQQLIAQAIQQLFALSRNTLAYRRDAAGNIIDSSQNMESADFYAAYDERQQLLGFVIRAQGMGYQDKIELLYGYRPQQNLLRSYIIVASRETPGLGTKIETDNSFIQQFAKLPVPLSKNGLQNPLQAVRPTAMINKDETPEPWKIDTISGATISSRAVINIINDSAQQWLPVLNRQQEVFKLGL